MIRSVGLVMNDGRATEQTVTALVLVERLLDRGVHVRVFAHDEASVLSAGDHPVAAAIAGLIRRGVRGGTLQWVVEGDATAALGVAGDQVRGTIDGDHGDLWGIVRDADLLLSVGVGG